MNRTKTVAMPKPGDVMVFKGCCWEEPQWEFSAPGVLYSPVKRYTDEIGSLCAPAIYDLVEDFCIDLVTSKESPVRGFSEHELDEFEWRGWDPRGFSRRKRAIHAEFSVRFFEERGELAFEITQVNPPPVEDRS